MSLAAQRSQGPSRTTHAQAPRGAGKPPPGGTHSETVMGAPAGPIGGTASGLSAAQDTHQLASLSILMMGMLDPMAMMTGMQSVLRDKGTEASENDMEVQGVRGEVADQARAASIQEAREAAEAAISGLPGWLQDVIGTVLAVVGAAASVVTGGASVALVVIGAVLLAGAEIIQLAVDEGLLPEEWTYVAMGLKLVASVVMSFGAGAATAGADILQKAVTIAADVANYVNMAVSSVNTGIAVNNAVVLHDVTNLRLDAEGHAIESDEANDAVEVAADRLKDSIQTFGRAMRRIQSIVHLQGEISATVVA